MYKRQLVIRFNDPPEYKLWWCTQFTSFQIPDKEADGDHISVWRLSKTNFPTVTVFCDDVEVIKITMSDNVCYDGDWDEIWSRRAGQLDFTGDTCSRHYRSPFS